MDPDVALTRMRQLSRDILSRGSESDDADDLAAVAQGLDEWITNGGFLPHEWQVQQVPRSSFVPVIVHDPEAGR